MERPHEFDRVVIAAHGDQALRMLADPTAWKRICWDAFTIRKTKPCSTPTRSSCRGRAAAGRRGTTGSTARGRRNRHSTHYWMNELQGVSDREQYFVSINPPSSPAGDPSSGGWLTSIRCSIWPRSRRRNACPTLQPAGRRNRSLFLRRVAALRFPRGRHCGRR